MKWLDEIERALDHEYFNTIEEFEEATRKLIKAVRLAERRVNRALAHVDSPRDTAEELGGLLTCLRSGDVEGKT